MSLTSDLLDQAKHLATKENRKPKQASLSRAVSTAYYALFHMLTQAASSRLLRGKEDASLRPLLRRAFTHGDMVNAAKGFKNNQPIALVSTALNARIPPALNTVAATFIELQEYRHQADYNTSRVWSRIEVLNLIHRANEAERAWQQIQRHKAATAFLVNMLVHERLKGR